MAKAVIKVSNKLEVSFSGNTLHQMRKKYISSLVFANVPFLDLDLYHHERHDMILEKKMMDSKNKCKEYVEGMTHKSLLLIILKG